MHIATTTNEMIGRLGVEAGLEAIARAGFDAVDYGMFPSDWHAGELAADDAAFEAYFARVRRALDAAGLYACQAHAPFPTAVGDAREDGYRLGVTRRAIRAAHILGAPLLVIHPVFGGAFEGQDMLAYNLERYAALIPDLGAAGVRAAVENMFGADSQGNVVPSYMSTAREMAQVVDTLGTEHFCACLDIGHAGLVGEDPAAMARALGGRMRLLHVHDNDGKRDLHTIPFIGVNDWDAICRALAQAGYAGVMSLEADSFVGAFPAGLENEALALMAAAARRLADSVEEYARA